MSFVTSSPGKVILFGEHSAVYNEPAVAASVSALRSYLFLQRGELGRNIVLDFSDIKLHSVWEPSRLNEVRQVIEQDSTMQEEMKNTKELCSKLVEEIESKLLCDLKNVFHHHAALSFLYLYFCICPNAENLSFSVKSTLPIGAGLGSSASISVVLVLTMLKLSGSITSTERLDEADKKLINSWAFIGEKCIHGTPSGIDNTVATFGEAILFKREDDGRTTYEFLENFPEIPIVLTYTKIPRSTKELVDRVRELVHKQPKIVKPLLRSMGEIAVRGAELLCNLDDSNYLALLELVRINHGVLVSLGVSHPGLETVKAVSDSVQLGSTKLTGAGGGGCAFTILRKPVDEALLSKTRQTLEETHNFETYKTGLGGMGCSFVETSSMQASQVEQLNVLFTDTAVTRSDIDALLNPSAGVLSWVH